MNLELALKVHKLSEALISGANKIDDYSKTYAENGYVISIDGVSRALRETEELTRLGVVFENNDERNSPLRSLIDLAISLDRHGDEANLGQRMLLVCSAMSNAALTYVDEKEAKVALLDRFDHIAVEGLSEQQKMIALISNEIENIGYRMKSYDQDAKLEEDDVAFLIEKAMTLDVGLVHAGSHKPTQRPPRMTIN